MNNNSGLGFVSLLGALVVIFFFSLSQIGCAAPTKSQTPVVASAMVADADLTYAPSSHGDYEVIHALSKDAPATQVDTDLIATPAQNKATRNTLFSCDKQGKVEVCGAGRLQLSLR